MKKLIIAFILGSALFVQADTEIRFLYFYPATGRAQLFVTTDGFSRSEPTQLSALPVELQGYTASALAWMQSKLPPGVTSIEQIIIEPGPAVATAFDQQGEPSAWSRSLSGSVTGSGEKGERTISISDAPPEIREALLAIWDSLQLSLN